MRFLAAVLAASVLASAGAACATDPGPFVMDSPSGERAQLFGERPRYPGPRPYWENDPLFSAPLR